MGIEVQTGFWFRLWNNDYSEYRLLIQTGITYFPFVAHKPRGEDWRFTATDYSPNWLSLAVEVRPYQT
jgi:hypothetical protein